MNRFVRGMALILAIVVLAPTQSVLGATIPYVNNFDSTGLTNAAAQFSLDSGNGIFNYVGAPGTVASTASEPITGLGSQDFVVSSRLTLNSNTGTGSQATIGFGAFGSSSTFASTGGNSYYLADWGVTQLATAPNSWANLRILAQGDAAGFAGAAGDSDGADPNGSSLVVGNAYEMRLTGTYLAGTLNMTLAIFDGVGNQLGTAATATDTSPLVGQFFGYRDRTAGANHNISVGYDDFRVIAVPESASWRLLIAGMLGCAASQAARRSTYQEWLCTGR